VSQARAEPVRPKSTRQSNDCSLLCRGAIFLGLTLAIVALFVTAPRAGQFWWSDAPRHALNGAFLRDFFSSLPLRDAKQWAVDYYLQYPALTILFYPPMYAAVEAVFFGLFGVSDAVASLSPMAFCGSLAVGAYYLSRRWLPPLQAASAALLLLGLPEIARWGRQTMTDVPAMSFLVWSSYLFVRYQDEQRIGLFLGAILVFLLGLYTKLSIVFLFPPLLVVLWMQRGRSLLRDKWFWIGGVLLAVGVMPLVLMTWKFGQGNIESVVSIKDARVSRLALEGWLYYPRLLPSQVGWVTLGAAVTYLVVATIRKAWRPCFPAFPLLVLWLVAGYLFFSAIDLKDPRLDIFILLPLPLFAILLLNRGLPPKRANAAALCLAIGGFSYTLWAAPVPVVHGYQEAAQWVADHTEPDSIVVFSGMRDGSFIFNLRTLDPSRQHTVIRADKLLLRIAIRRELGVREKSVTTADVIDMLDRHGVSYVVAERDFWIDLKAMQVFQEALGTPHFKEVARIPVTANIPHPDQELRIYRNLGPVAKPPEKLTVDLPVIGLTFEGGPPAHGGTQ
jgi:hypothetical protein